MVIIKLGGTNGSGKTSIARALIYLTLAEPVHYMGKTIGYRSQQPGNSWVILGDYTPRCGGLDAVPGHDNKVVILERFMQEDLDFIFFESYATGVSYKNFGSISERMMNTTPWLYAFLDTPVSTCIERVATRQGKRPDTYTPPKTLIAGHKRMVQAAYDAADAGHHVIWLDHKDSPVNLAARLVLEAGSLVELVNMRDML